MLSYFTNKRFLFLSVHPGFYGKEFIPGVLDKIVSLRKSHKNVKIEIDGGIKLSNVKMAVKAGCDRITVGSAIFQAKNPALELERFVFVAGSPN